MVLTVDPASPSPADIVSRISFGVTDATTWIDIDGSWGNGALRGRHEVAVAGHIGAAARAAERAARSEAVEAQLAVLATATSTEGLAVHEEFVLSDLLSDLESR